MRIGIPKEIKSGEKRVAITPAGVSSLVGAGHKVLIEAGAGLGSMISDESYAQAGAQILEHANEVWERAEMIIKVKEPLQSEYKYFRKGLILFAYLHLAAAGDLAATLMKHGVVGIGYETVQLDNGALPLLAPMSEVAGRFATQLGAMLLTSHQGGSGVLLGGIPGVAAGKVVILGGGAVGTSAAKMAIGLGAQVTIFNTSIERLRFFDDTFGSRIQTMASNRYNIAEYIEKADLVIGAVLHPGGKAPMIVTEDMVKTMRPGSVIIDVAIDQGGCIETCDTVTTHDNPVYIRHGVLHYAVPNIPAAVPRTSTFGLTNATTPYALQIADLGWERACREVPAIAKGMNTVNGACVYKAVAEAVNVEYTPLEKFLS